MPSGSELVIAKYRVLQTYGVYAAILALGAWIVWYGNGESYFNYITNRKLTIPMLRWWFAFICWFTLIAICVPVVLRLLLLNVTAVFIRNGDLVYGSSLLFCVSTSDIEGVDVFREQNPFVLTPSVRVLRRLGKTRYIRTALLDVAADDLARRIATHIVRPSEVADIFD